MTRLTTCWASCFMLLTIGLSAWAVQGDIVSVDDWVDYPVGTRPLSVPGPWKVYSSMTVFKYPPTVVVDDAQRALRLKTDHETMAIGRAMHLDVTPLTTLTWEWKPLVLPVGGDVRAYVAQRNDQAAPCEFHRERVVASRCSPDAPSRPGVAGEELSPYPHPSTTRKVDGLVRLGGPRLR